MKKYIFTAFLLVFWCVAAIFIDAKELILIAGFSLVLGGILFIKKRSVPIVLAAGVCVGVSIYDINFLTRLTPALLLIFSHNFAMTLDFDKKKKKKSVSDAVYTFVLIAGLIAVGTLINDILFLMRNPISFAFSRMQWIFAGILVYFVLFVFRFAKRAHKTQSYRVFMPIYVCAFVCFIFAAIGFLLNSSLYNLYFAFFPWLIFLAFIAAADDPSTVYGAEGFYKDTTSFLSYGE